MDLSTRPTRTNVALIGKSKFFKRQPSDDMLGQALFDATKVQTGRKHRSSRGTRNFIWSKPSLANWTKSQVWNRILLKGNEIPYNPLHDKGYPSIGCWPCTRQIMIGEDNRAGRWSGTAKTECGLHTTEDGPSNG